MPTVPVVKPYEFFTGSDGKPLENGFIYIGAASFNPETAPITIYWDSLLTIPAAQPVRTVAGYPSRYGVPGKLYTNNLYSITVRDKNGVLVFNLPVSDANSIGGDSGESGSGLKNYIKQPDFESGVANGWNLGKDTGTITPASGGIGGGSSQFSPLTIDFATPLAGSASLFINKPATTTQASTVYSDNFTIDREDAGQTMAIEFSYQTPSGGLYSDGDLAVFLWDVNGAALVPLSGNAIAGTSGVAGKMKVTYTNTVNLVYRLIFMWTSAVNANAMAIEMDSISVGPEQTPIVVGGYTAVLVQMDSTLTKNSLNIIDAPTPQKLTLSLPAATVGDYVDLECRTACDIVQGTADDVISWFSSLFTTKGTSGRLRLLPNERAKLIYRGSGWASQAPVKITDPATLPGGNGRGSAWSPDGRYLAIAHETTPFVTIYDWISGSPVKIANPATLPTGNGTQVAWSPDGRYLAVSNADTSPYITFYDWQTGSPVKITNPATLPTGHGAGCAWSPDGRFFAVTHSVSPFITIYDWITGSPVKITNPATLPAGTSANGVAWSPDGRYLAVGHTATPFITFYDWATGVPIKIANPATLATNGVYEMSWSPDGRYFAAAFSSSPYLIIYDWISGAPVKFPDLAALPNTGFSTSWSPDGRYLAVSHSTTPFVTIYDWISGVPVKIANPATLPISTAFKGGWSPDGRYLALGHTTTPFITIYDWRLSASREWVLDIKYSGLQKNLTGIMLAPRFK
jgi:WD40 repeat protein